MRGSGRLSGPWAVLLVLAAACADREPEQTEGAEPDYGGTVVIVNNSNLRDLNPLVSGEKFEHQVNRYMLFLPLLQPAEDLSYEPVLAERWEMLGDTGVVFHLRRDVRWHDGMPTTAHDVVFTFERAKDPLTAYPDAGAIQLWKHAVAIDSFTVRFGLDPHLEALGGWLNLPIVPMHLLDSVPPARMAQAAFNRAPVGNGPFRFVETRQNDRWVFEANPDFPAALGGRPYLDRIVWRGIPDGTAQITELQTGGADIVLTPTAEQYAQLRGTAGLRGIEVPFPQFSSVVWNGLRPPFDDPRVRRALGLAIDRQQMIQTLRAGFGTPAIGPVGPSHWAFDPALEALPYSPDSATALLRAAGIEDRDGDVILELPGGEPFEIELKYPAGSTMNRNIAEILQGDLSKIGVRIVPRATDWGTMIEDFTSRERRFEAFLIGWSNDFRLNLYDTFHGGARGTPNQFASYANARVDSLIDLTLRDRTIAEARPHYAEIQQILRDEQPWSFLYFYPDLVLVRDRLQGVEMDKRGALRSIARWWVTDSQATPARGDSAARSQLRDSAPAQ